MLHAALWKCRTQKFDKKSPSAHHRTTLSDYIFVTKARVDGVDNRKKLLSSNISSRCSHNMANFGALAAEIDPVVWSTPGNFNGFRVLAALLHGTQLGCPKLVNRSQSLVGRSSPYCEDISLLNKFFFRLSICALVAKI